MIFACFYVSYPYYFPHFLPISNEMQSRGLRVHYILADQKNTFLMEKIAKDNNLDYSLGEACLFEIPAQFCIFANQNQQVKNLTATTVFLEHGVGSKSMRFYSCIEYFDLYIVEGDHKFKRLSELYPTYQYKLRKVGFSKFDSMINMTDHEIRELQEKYQLDPKKKTILYAPTFFPSSIEKMANSFPQDFNDCNILIKAHYLTYERRQYKKQRHKLEQWNKATNCHLVNVDEYNLVPLFGISDLLISDESSAMFEFACLNKPVISNRYVKLRLSYYLMPWKLGKRIDQTKDKYREILHNAYSYEETIKLTRSALEDPSQKEMQRLAFAEDICGKIDGKVSQRIVDALEHELT